MATRTVRQRKGRSVTVAEPADVRAPRPGTGTSLPERAPEWALAWQACRALAAMALPAVGLATLVAGGAGALSAAMGLALVGGLFGFSVLLTSAVGRVGSQTALAVAASAVVLRLAVYLAVLLAMLSMAGLHPPSMAITALAALTVTLAHEIRYMVRTPQLVWLRV